MANAETIAGTPKSIEVDGMKVVNRSVKEIMEAERYEASKAAMLRRDRGIRFTKIRKSGQVGGE